MRSHFKQLGGDTFIYGIGMAVGQLSSFFLLPLYTRVFSPSEYGIVALILSFISLQMVIVAGLDNAVGRWFYDSNDITWQKIVVSIWFWFQIVTGLVIVIVSVLFDDKISMILLGNTEYSRFIILGSIVMFLGIFNKLYQQWLRYLRKPLLMVFFTVSFLVLKVGIIIYFLFKLILFDTFVGQCHSNGVFTKTRCRYPFFFKSFCD